jgi:hypothetical protein
LVAATRALDRVLLWHYYVVPQFTYGFLRSARWDRFSHAPLPKYGRSGLPSLWWPTRRRPTRSAGVLDRALAAARSFLAAAPWLPHGRRLVPRLNLLLRLHPNPMACRPLAILKYPADFKNFDYVNVSAPKGGVFSTILFLIP